MPLGLTNIDQIKPKVKINKDLRLSLLFVFIDLKNLKLISSYCGSKKSINRYIACKDKDISIGAQHE